MEGPNTGAALIEDGKLIAMAEEERFARVKTASNYFPNSSIKYCLKEAKINLTDVKAIGVGWDHNKYPEKVNDHMRNIPHRDKDEFADTAETVIHLNFSKEWTLMKIKNSLKKIDRNANPEIRFYGHHLSHAASVHYLSGFEKSSILCMDGSGEEIATTMWQGENDNIELIKSWSLPDSIGWFYAAITEFLGFKAYSGEGKVMGLAAYGNPDKNIADKLKKILYKTEEGYSLDPTYIYYGERTWNKNFTDKLVELLGTPRSPESQITEYHQNVAYEAQKLLEEIGISLTKNLINRTGCENLCLTGGVVMNCKMNGVLSQLNEVKNIFINPASHDSGTAIGAAFLAAKEFGEKINQDKLTHAYYGPRFTDEEIKEALDACKLNYSKLDNPSKKAAELLNEGNIVGWFQGRLEFGARALGNRSILANPTIKDMKNIINAQVKFREPFRPFAPSMIIEALDQYILNGEESPFMILAYEVQEGISDKLPSVVHVDNTVRPQTVRKETNPRYWELINEFGKLTGHSIILNTSFNIRGEPIVCTPNEAVRCFYATGMDALVIGSFLLTKQQK